MVNKLYKSEAWLKKRYQMERKTPQEIADECGVTLATIYTHIDKFNLRKSWR
jgi:hypothetical protein